MLLFFLKNSKTKIKHVDLRIGISILLLNNPKSDFGIDDLNILMGNFKGNHKKLNKFSNLKFQSVSNC